MIARTMFFSAGAPVEEDEKGYEEYRKKVDVLSRRNKRGMIMVIALALVSFAISVMVYAK